MTKMSEFKRLHRKLLSEASGEKPLDDIAFADERKGVPSEPDNHHEHQMFVQLRSFLLDNRQMNEELAKEAIEFVRKGLYSDVFRAPDPGATIWRGMVVPRTYLMNALDKFDEERLDENGTFSASFTFTPYSGIMSSWSLDKQEAADFTGISTGIQGIPRSKQVKIVLEAKVSDNPGKLIDCEGGLYELTGLGATKHEREVIGVWSVKVCRVYWSFNEWEPMRIRESSNEKPLDDTAFADEREGAVPPEPDNDFEKKLYNALLWHFEDNVPLSKGDAIRITDMLKAGMYSDVFKKPQYPQFWRGMSVGEKYIKDALGLGTDDVLPPRGARRARFTFTPHAGSSSWTQVPDIAGRFILDEESEVGLILEAEVSDNPHKLLQCDDYLYTVGALGDEHGDEAEVVGLGPIKVRAIYWAPRGETVDIDVDPQ